MKIRLHPEDCARYDVPEVLDFDQTRIGLRELAAVQKVTGLNADKLDQALRAEDFEALAALVWLAVGRAAGKRPDWDSFEVNAQIVIEGDEPEVAEPGKAQPDPGNGPVTTTSNRTSEPGAPPSPSTTASAPGNSTS